MTPPPPEPADAIFAAALNLPAAERPAHIAAACGRDSALLGEVNALLAAHESAPTGFLSAPTSERFSDTQEDLDATIDVDGSGKISGKPAGLLAGSPAPVEPPAGLYAAAETPGEMIGRYKLLQEISEGGFGTVWMAEQTEPVTRRVALKIIKLGMEPKK